MEKNAEIINDLIKVNSDRAKGYEKAAKETKDRDVDLRGVFSEMADESRNYSDNLEQYVRSMGDTPAEGTTVYGDVYRAWMDVKATFAGKDRKAILSSCEFGEDAAQRAYEKALKETNLTLETRRIISDQKTRLKRSHDKIKTLRDQQPA